MMKSSSALGAIPWLVWMCTLTASTNSFADVIPDDAAEAFKLGQSLFADEEYLKAAEAFEWAYRLAPHPDVLANIGYCYDEAGDHVRAASYYRKYLRDPNPNDRSTKQKIKRYLKKVLANVGDLRVSCQPMSCKVTVDNVYRGSGPIALALEPGAHTLEVSFTDDRPTRQFNIFISRGEKQTIDADQSGSQPSSTSSTQPTSESPTQSGSSTLQPDLTPRDTETNRATLRPPFWIATTATILGAATAGVLGGLAYTTWKNFKQSDSQETHLKERGEKLRLGTNIAIGVTAAAATTAIILAIVDVKRAQRKNREIQTSRLPGSNPRATLAACGPIGVCLRF